MVHPPERYDAVFLIDLVLDAEGCQVRRVNSLQMPVKLCTDTMRVL